MTKDIKIASPFVTLVILFLGLTRLLFLSLFSNWFLVIPWHWRWLYFSPRIIINNSSIILIIIIIHFDRERYEGAQNALKGLDVVRDITPFIPEGQQWDIQTVFLDKRTTYSRMLLLSFFLFVLKYLSLWLFPLHTDYLSFSFMYNIMRFSILMIYYIFMWFIWLLFNNY